MYLTVIDFLSDFYRIGVETIDTTVGGDRYGGCGAYTAMRALHEARFEKIPPIYQRRKVGLTSRRMYCTVYGQRRTGTDCASAYTPTASCLERQKE
jgi:hypothetical protein